MKDCKDFYNDSAQLWADNWYENNSLLPYLKALINYTNKKHPKILDLGCGAGYESMRLNSLGADVIGIDFSEKELEIAKNRNPNVKFFERDILQSYKDLGKFDGIACIGVIVHFKGAKLKKIFKNMCEVLNKDGVLLLVFKEGKGYHSTSVYNGQEYERNFVYHTKENLISVMNDEFYFVEDLISNDDWKYFIFKKK